MSTDKFIKKWEKQGGGSIFSKIGARIHPTPLRERLAHSLYRLNVLQSRLEQTASKMEYKSKELFEKCVNAQSAKDFERAKVYANECAEIRKIAKVVLSSQIAIEQVALRLETVEEFGDIAATMGPVVGVVNALKGQLSGVVPEASYELGVIGESLGELVMEAGEATGTTVSLGSYSAESQKILAEASTVADQRMKEKFPELPVQATPLSEKLM